MYLHRKVWGWGKRLNFCGKSTERETGNLKNLCDLTLPRCLYITIVPFQWTFENKSMLFIRSWRKFDKVDGKIPAICFFCSTVKHYIGVDFRYNEMLLTLWRISTWTLKNFEVFSKNYLGYILYILYFNIVKNGDCKQLCRHASWWPEKGPKHVAYI